MNLLPSKYIKSPTKIKEGENYQVKGFGFASQHLFLHVIFTQSNFRHIYSEASPSDRYRIGIGIGLQPMPCPNPSPQYR